MLQVATSSFCLVTWGGSHLAHNKERGGAGIHLGMSPCGRCHSSAKKVARAWSELEGQILAKRPTASLPDSQGNWVSSVFTFSGAFPSPFSFSWVVLLALGNATWHLAAGGPCIGSGGRRWGWWAESPGLRFRESPRVATWRRCTTTSFFMSPPGCPVGLLAFIFSENSRLVCLEQGVAILWRCLGSPLAE